MANNINNPDDLNAMLEQMRVKLDSSNALRDPIIQKLAKTVEGINIDFENDRPSVIEQKLAVISKLDDMLKSSEATEVTKVKMSMQKRVDDASVDLKQQAVEIIKNLAPSAVITGQQGFIATEEPDEALIEKKIEQAGLIPIKEQEMDMGELSPAEALNDK